MTATDLSSPPEKRNLIQRVLSALVLIPLVLGILIYGSPLLICLLVLIIAVIGWSEYANLIDAMGVPTYKFTGFFLTVIFVWAHYFQMGLNMPQQNHFPFMLRGLFELWPLLALTVLFAVCLKSDENLQTGLERVVYTLFGSIYVGGLLGFFLQLSNPETGSKYVFFVFLVVWMGDIAGYFVGKAIGRHKLAPRVSPGKTIEGAVANTLGGMAGGALAIGLFLPSLGWLHGLLVAGICAIIGQFGDLFESFLKRSAGVKDSGSLIPGHGGVLDRIDSLLFAGPAFYYVHNAFGYLDLEF